MSDQSDPTPGSPSTPAAKPPKADAPPREPRTMVRIAAVVVVLAIGVAARMGLASMKEPPKQAEAPQRVLRVETIEAAPEDHPVTITGYGQANSLSVVPVAAEVSGRIVEIHPDLREGTVVEEGALLFRIDPRDYTASLEQARAQQAQMRHTITLLRQQLEIDRERLATMTRSEALAKSELERVRALFEQDDVGTQSGVDAAEVAYNRAVEARQQLQQAVELSPTRIREAESGLNAAAASVELSSTRLARTEVRAPFRARVKGVSLEAGQFVSPGTPLLTLADDRILEISVPIDSRDARSWLRFSADAQPDAQAWFGDVEPVTCRVYWTEDTLEQHWEGSLHRVERFDQQTRTVTLAVRVNGDAVSSGPDALPLVDGMFCRVEIPGKVMQSVYRLPRWAVTFENKVYLAENGQLKIREVTLLRSEGEEAYVSGGLAPGDNIIVTRLINPLPNSLVEVLKGEGNGPISLGAETGS
jgi:RND family efflux transporter MFP subunit